MMLNLHIHSRHEHAAWGYRGTMAPYMDAAGMKIHEGGPAADDHYDVVVAHTVGGWSDEGVSKWGRERGMKVIEVMHSNARSITPPEFVDHFVGMNNIATNLNLHMPNRSTIYVIVDVDKFSVEPTGPAKIGKLSRLVHEKGVLEFMEIARQFPDESFVLAGDGPLMEQIRLSKPANLELIGMIRDFPSFYASLILFVYPTKDECCSASVAMAQSAGVPIIAQDIPALRETTGGRTAGWAVTVEEFCGKIESDLCHLDDPDMLAYQANAVVWADLCFSPDVTVRAWDELIESLI